MYSIFSSIRDLAGILKFAATLTIEDFKKIIQKLHDILEDEKNFDMTSEIPLKFSPSGIQKLKNIEGYDFSKQTDMTAVLKRLTVIVDFAGKAGNKELVQLLKNINKPGHWINVDLKNKDFVHAQTYIIRNALEFALDQAKRELEPEKTHGLGAPGPSTSPQELQEMKERGVI
jgi:hypothetical protein